jgi:hypothetical protein
MSFGKSGRRLGEASFGGLERKRRSRFSAALRNDNKKARQNDTRIAETGGSGSAGEAQAGAEFGGGFAVAEEAEGAEIVEVALAAAFSYGADVVGVP